MTDPEVVACRIASLSLIASVLHCCHYHRQLLSRVCVSPAELFEGKGVEGADNRFHDSVHDLWVGVLSHQLRVQLCSGDMNVYSTR